MYLVTLHYWLQALALKLCTRYSNKVSYSDMSCNEEQTANVLLALLADAAKLHANRLSFTEMCRLQEHQR